MAAQFQTPSGVKENRPVPHVKAQASARIDIFLAILPFLLILVIDALPMLLLDAGLLILKAPALQVLTSGLIILLVIVSLGILFLAWRKQWPDWSATWYFFFGAAPLLLVISLLVLFLQDERLMLIIQPVIFFLLLPALIAVLLYFVTRLDRLRGLLAALPVLYLVWLPNMEMVPDRIEMVIKLASTVLVCLVIVYLLRQTDWRNGLFGVLAVYLVVGALFSYAGIYHGGTLPGFAPGPSIIEVARSLIPQYLAMSAILLGPLFAWKLRLLGRAGGRASQIGYHMALAGLLLVILANLGSLMVTMDNLAGLSSRILVSGIIVGLAAYFLGIVWLYQEAPFPKGMAEWSERVLLLVLPLLIPVAFVLPFITWTAPISRLYWVPLLWEVPHLVSLSLGLVWLALSIWLVTRRPPRLDPAAALQDRSEMAQAC